MSSTNCDHLTNGQIEEVITNGQKELTGLQFDTRALHAGQDPSQWTSRAVIPPISMSTTFKQFSPANHAVSLTLHYRLYKLHKLQSVSEMPERDC